MQDGQETVFRFTAEGVDLEFAGSEEFVEKQVQRFRTFLEGAIGHLTPGARAEEEEAAQAGAAKGPETLQAFYDARPTRAGRGAIQDRILLFVYYLQHVQGKQAVSKEDISWCFQQVGLSIPKNLLNALGNMKRKLNFLQGGGRRGLYQLSPKGQQYVEQRFQPAA
ncbi:MAG: hypothetical protein ACYTG6_01125 [Planctomycetota bacterium]|jgi:hypothetical protein